MKKDLKKLSPSDLEAVLAGCGQPRWRVTEIRRWLYGRGVREITAMTSLPADLREKLGRDYTISVPAVTGRKKAEDGTVKLTLAFWDEAPCETVLIPGSAGYTLCLSSQSGCPLGCAFCQTGRMGAGRNLHASEMVDQWRAALSRTREGKGITNLVFMGMGEPLLNFEALREAIEIFTSPQAAKMSPSRITVSTAGIVPGIERMGRELPRVNLAVSLNSPEDDLRTRLMPVNRKYPLGALMAALRRYPEGRRRLTVEYVLLGGTNDSPEMARRLASLLRGLRCKVNLIPFNPHSGLPFSAPSEESIEAFRDILGRAGFTAPVRRSRGAEIAAACGQLGSIQRQRRPP